MTLVSRTRRRGEQAMGGEWWSTDLRNSIAVWNTRYMDVALNHL
ncbi:transposase [Ktedonobacter robiniae]|nr:transposase [Ktedonobacter robiniae]